ncbi:MAG TPA: hypothetical protein VFC46_10365 [Humisphaera sp.]|nr:hypothetical protein [Humisphaera sp.]
MIDPPDKPPPHPLTYEPQAPDVSVEPRSTPAGLVKFLAGLLLGTTMSAAAWIGGWEKIAEIHGAPMYMLAFKFSLGSVLLFFVRGWRSFGVGILVSICLGLLILVGTCFDNFRF